MDFQDATIEEIDEAMQKAWKAFHAYRKLSLKQRAGFMRAIAKELEMADDELIQTAMIPTHPKHSSRTSTRKRCRSIMANIIRRTSPT